MDSSAAFRSSAASAEIAIGADDLESLDHGERRRQKVERLRIDRGAGAVLGLVESLADSDWRVRRSAAQALAGDSDVDASALLGDLLYSDNAGERNAAIKALIKRGGESIAVLVEHLSSDVADVRNFSALALGQIGDPAALAHLIPMLDTEEDENVRHMLIEAIGCIGDESAVHALLEVLEENTFASAAAAEALGTIASKRAIRQLAGKLGDDPIGAACAEALGRIGDVRSLVPLVHSAANASAFYGACAVRALAGIVKVIDDGTRPVFRRITADVRDSAPITLRDAVNAALRSEGPDREAGMVVALWLGDPSFAPSVCQAAETSDLIEDASRFLAENLEAVRSQLDAAERSSFPAVRSVLVRALVAAGDERDIPRLLRLTGDENMSVRTGAIEALAKLGGAEHIEVFVDLLHDEFDEIRFAAAEALAGLGPLRVAGALGKSVELGDERVRESVARMLASLPERPGDEALWDIALTLARDPSPLVRRQVAPALGMIPGHEALSVLFTLALDVDHLLRVTAIRTLATRKEPTVRRVLRQAVEEGSTSITAAAVKGLAVEASTEDIELMRSLLHSSDPGVLVATLAALGKCGGSREIPVVAEHVEHAVPDVREAALRALLALGWPGVCEVAARVLGGQEESWNVRLAAVEALESCDAPQASDLLERAISDPEPLVRIRAVRAMAGVSGPAAPERLIALLDDSLLSQHAAESLVSLGAAAVSQLLAHAASTVDERRAIACLALGRIGTPEALSYLVAQLRASDADSRWAAALGLSVSDEPGALVDELRNALVVEKDVAVAAAIAATLHAESASPNGVS